MKRIVKKRVKPNKRKSEITSVAPQNPEEPDYTSIFEDIIRDSCACCATDDEIAALLGMSVEKLLELGKPLLDKHRALARVSLRKKLFRLVDREIGASASVAVWLSKQHLGMVEPEKQKESEDGPAIIEVVDYSKS